MLLENWEQKGFKILVYWVYWYWLLIVGTFNDSRVNISLCSNRNFNKKNSKFSKFPSMLRQYNFPCFGLTMVSITKAVAFFWSNIWYNLGNHPSYHTVGSDVRA